MTDYPVNAAGDVQVPLDEGDVLPREIAVKTDDPPHIVKMIEEINARGTLPATEFQAALERVDAARREFHGVANPDLAADLQPAQKQVKESKKGSK